MPQAQGTAIDWEPVFRALREGDVVMALEMYEASVRVGGKPPGALNSEIAAAHVSRGNDLARRNLWELALQRYRRARRLDPTSGEAALRMGLAFREMGATGAALACLREAQELLRKRSMDQFSRHYLADAHFNEGRILEGQGQLRPARTAMKKALEVKPDYHEVRGLLEQILPRLPGGGSGGAATDREVLGGLLESLAAFSPERRREAMAALRDFPEWSESRAAAMRLSDSDPDPDVRFEARRTLGALPRAPGAVSPPPAATGSGSEWLAQALKVMDPTTRRQALAEAARAPESSMAPLLAAHLPSESDGFALAQAIALLASTGAAEHAKLLEPFLAHASCRVVANAIEAIARLAGELPLGLLLPLLESGDNRVRANALMSAVGARRPPVLDHLARMASSDRESMRASALYCLERIEDPRTEEIALEMLRRENSADLLWREASLLARVATPRSAPTLEKLRDGDPDRQGYAVYLLQLLAER